MPPTAWTHLPEGAIRYADWNDATLSVAQLQSPRIQPQIVFRIAKPAASGDPAAVVEAAEWIALAFEIVDASGRHAVIVGEPVYIDSEDVSRLAGELEAFTVRVLKNNQLVEQGDGRNAFGGGAALREGDFVTAGPLVNALPIASGDVWIAALSGIPPSALTLRVI